MRGKGLKRVVNRTPYDVMMMYCLIATMYHYVIKDAEKKKQHTNIARTRNNVGLAVASRVQFFSHNWILFAVTMILILKLLRKKIVEEA